MRRKHETDSGQSLVGECDRPLWQAGRCNVGVGSVSTHGASLLPVGSFPVYWILGFLPAQHRSHDTNIFSDNPVEEGELGAMRLFDILRIEFDISLDSDCTPRPMWLWKLREWWRRHILRRRTFSQIYAEKVWTYLNSPEGARRFEELKKIPWGTTVGWRNRKPCPFHDAVADPWQVREQERLHKRYFGVPTSWDKFMSGRRMTYNYGCR